MGHSSLRELRINGESNYEEECCDFGAALAALIAADAPALHVLDCSDNKLTDAGLAPIVEALPLNHHLRELNCRDNGMSEAFARQRLLPAVRANTSLQTVCKRLRFAAPSCGESGYAGVPLVTSPLMRRCRRQATHLLQA